MLGQICKGLHSARVATPSKSRGAIARHSKPAIPCGRSPSLVSATRPSVGVSGCSRIVSSMRLYSVKPDQGWNSAPPGMNEQMAKMKLGQDPQEPEENSLWTKGFSGVRLLFLSPSSLSPLLRLLVFDSFCGCYARFPSFPLFSLLFRSSCCVYCPMIPIGLISFLRCECLTCIC